MLHVEIDQADRLAVLKPDGPLEKSDFENAAKQIDPFIEQVGKLNGIMICVEKFPGWDSFAAFIRHMKFVKEHHRQVKRVAFVTDSSLGDTVEELAGHFVAAEVERFPFAAFDEARSWVLDA